VFDLAMRLGTGRLSPAGPGGRLSIAIFHRVLAQPDPMFPDEMDSRSFDEVCAWFKAWFQVLPLDEAVQRLQSGSLPARALAITFDDGYVDNHDVAMPILRKHGLCATFFIATGYLNGGRMWNDTLVESVRGCKAGELDLTGLGLPGSSRWPLANPAQRRAAADGLLGTIKYLPYGERLAVVDRVAERADARLPDDLMMSSEQVRGMARGGMQLGAHTVSHPILARLDDAQARDEIVRSKAAVEDIAGQQIRLFAYPNGRPGTDYGPRDVALVRQAGFMCAVSTAAGAATQGADVFQLPRFTPWSRTRLRFGALLARNLWAARSSAPASV
jgi:peptidoglycan/xylan/chitin deacetylase (PgdA/CDA1 family)